MLDSPANNVRNAASGCDDIEAFAPPADTVCIPADPMRTCTFTILERRILTATRHSSVFIPYAVLECFSDWVCFSKEH